MLNVIIGEGAFWQGGEILLWIGSAGLFGGGGGANSLLGATGAPTLLARMTRYLGAAFAVTCIGLSMDGCQEGSVTDQVRPPLSSPSFPVEEAPTPAQEIPADAPQE